MKNLFTLAWKDLNNLLKVIKKERNYHFISVEKDKVDVDCFDNDRQS
jgi:hypothetical protein